MRLQPMFHLYYVSYSWLYKYRTDRVQVQWRPNHVNAGSRIKIRAIPCSLVTFLFAHLANQHQTKYKPFEPRLPIGCYHDAQKYGCHVHSPCLLGVS